MYFNKNEFMFFHLWYVLLTASLTFIQIGLFWLIINENQKTMTILIFSFPIAFQVIIWGLFWFIIVKPAKAIAIASAESISAINNEPRLP